MVPRYPLWCAALGGVTAVLASMPATAAVVELQEQFSMPLSPGSVALSFNQFDDYDGSRQLESVAIAVDTELRAHVTAENNASIDAPDFALSISGFMTVDLASLGSFLTFDGTWQTDGSVEASDGIPGSGPDFWDFGVVSISGTDADQTASDLAAFIGDGTIEAFVFANAGFTISGATDSMLTLSDFEALGTVTVVYTYTVIPGAGAAALFLVATLVGASSGRRRREV